MPVSTAEFREWLERGSLSPSPTALSTLTGINRGTLNNQLRRGNVAESTVIAIARAIGANVIDALSVFSPYRIIRSRPIEPSPAEVLSQVHHADLMAELQFRTSQKHYPRGLRKEIDLIAFPHDGSVRAWIDAIDPGDVRQRMSQDTGMALTYIATQLTENKLNPHLAIAASKAGEGSFATGLVVTELITPAEGGWQIRAREDELLEVSDDVLVDAISARIHLLQRRVKQRKEAREYAEKMTELLG
ncbi:hypothetical protein [Arthrobacter oryzae]|nr:hypothetical protein [Arthrobacter oryzae]